MNNSNTSIIKIISFICLFTFLGCNKDKQEYLLVNPKSINFTSDKSSSSFTINTNAAQWDLSVNSQWIQVNKTTGKNGNTDVIVTTSENTTQTARSAVITINAGDAPTVQIKVTQQGCLYPSYNISPIEADSIGMNSNAIELAAKIKLGWNIGNSLEATGSETGWGNPKITKAFIDLVKQSGFNAIRIPCAWNQYMANSETAQIQSDWLLRVKNVVQYCIDNDMYVILNIHWDGGWLENNCTTEKQSENNAKQRAFWEQIATYFRNYDEHLLFASANEPNVNNATQMDVLQSYHQTFINAVRSTGGKNVYRNLVIQGPSTDIKKTYELLSSLPTDITPNRMMVEIHYYTPWNFCGLTEDSNNSKMFYYWGNNHHSTTDVTHNATWGEENEVDDNFLLMKTQFVNKGIPVILGEYAVIRRSNLTGNNLTNHLASRAYFLEYVTKQAIANCILPFYWDNGATGNGGCALFNRNTNTVFDQQALDALVLGASE